MCHIIGQAIELADRQAEERGLTRRSLIKRSAGAAAVGGLVGLGLPGGALGHGAEGSHNDFEKGITRRAGAYRTRLVLLGTAGGPLWWPRTQSHGTASAVVVDGDVYMVDAGEGAIHQLRRAGLAGETSDRELLTPLRSVFFTHLHSDHIVDYNNLIQFGVGNKPAATPPVQVFGPGNRGELEPVAGPPPSSPLPVVSPEDPTPGTVEMTEYLFKAYATDLNDRIRDTRSVDPRSQFDVHNITVPGGLVVDPNANTAPPTPPFPVFEDDKVRVTATLVDHHPIYPAFGFRFDTDDGSIVFSGDTNPNHNLIKMAAAADVLVHEVIDRQWAESLFPDPTTPEAQAAIVHLLGAHTLIEDVGGVAEAAGAKSLVLNHLIPPYAPLRRWLQAKHGYSGRLIVGNDLLQVGVGRPSRRRR
jgi:ribonuclease BN (tRNA processing enzyme)